MKIAIVANTSWNIFNFRKGLVHFLIERGYEVTIIAPRDKYTDEIKKWHISYQEITLENKGTNPLADTRFFRKLLHLYKDLKPDIVLHFTIKPNIYGTLACRRLKIPCINNVSGLGTTFIRKSISSRIAHLLYRLAFRFAPKVFFQNEEDLRIFLDKKLVNFSQTGLLPGSGIDLVHFSPIKEQEQTTRKPFVFLMIARLIYDKGLREYVEAAKIVKNLYPDTQIELIGSYEKNTKHSLNITEQEIEQWKENISYLGAKADVRPYIQRADVVVLPSYREGTPRSLLEAAAMAKPLLATDVAGCREVVKPPKNGLLCEVKNAQDLAKKMIEMIEMPHEVLKEMGKESRLLAENVFDEKNVFYHYEEAIRVLLAKKRK